MRRSLAFSILFAVAPALAWSATRTVAKSGTPDFSTVQAAIDFFAASDPDPGVADTIQILDSAVYDEIFVVKAALTIEGNAAARPVLAAQTVPTAATTPASENNDGLTILIPGGTLNNVTLRNLIIIPSTTTPPADDLVRTTGQNVNLLLDNVLIAPNNGFGDPVSVDGLTPVALDSPVVPIGDDGAFLGAGTTPAGDGTRAVLRNTVITHTNGDGLVCSGSGSSFTIEDGCVFSYNARVGIQGAKDFEINAPTKRVLVLGNKAMGGIIFGSASPAKRILDGVNILNNTGFGIEHQNGDVAGVVGITVRNAIVAGQTTRGFQLGGTNATGPITIDKVTVAKNGGAAINVLANCPSAITVTDSILAGNGSSDTAVNVIIHNGTGTMSFSGSAVVLSGGEALAGTGFSGTGARTGSPISADPTFANTTDLQSPAFYDVQSVAYATAGTGSTPLAGGADYAPQAGVADWSMYH